MKLARFLIEVPGALNARTSSDSWQVAVSRAWNE